MSDKGQYVVTGYYGSIRINYNYPTADWALRKVRDFQHAGYEDIANLGLNGRVVSEADLAALVEGDPGSEASIDTNAPDVSGLVS